ncbi:MAG: hypothetical protein ACTSVK_16315 [Promethearchaeota archaeon]
MKKDKIILLYGNIFIGILIIISLFFLILDLLSFLIIFSQILGILLIILIQVLYLRELISINQYGIFVNKVVSDESWENITNYLKLIKNKASNENFNEKKMFFLNIFAILAIIFSLVLNIIFLRTIILFLAPSYLIICLVIIKYSESRSPINEVEVIFNWIKQNISLIFNELDYLKKFKTDSINKYFINLEDQLNILLQNSSDLEERFINFCRENITLYRVSYFLKNDISSIESIIGQIYKIRGKISVLMSIILKIREIHTIQFVDNFQKKNRMLEEERLKLISDKEKKFKELKNDFKETIIKLQEDFKTLIQDSFSKIEQFKSKIETFLSQEYSLKKEEILNKIKSDFEIIEQKYNKYYIKFNDLNKEIKNNYSLLQSKLTQLFFEKFYQEITKKIDYTKYDKEFIENFLFIADLFLIDLRQDLNEEMQEKILNKLCQIHNNLV